ncbi:putative zinc-binding metallopeptidase [Niabella sp. W65]|nr:putative zinc-binding metallopeptidase [Niabella sp. W65]MCH7368855.1 putative zinc-binding metallopeptidase [Niabella sp. W65]
MNELNPDVPLNTNSALDQWLKTNLLDMYNSEVIYRYSRYDHEYDRNITPIDEARVRPFMQSVLSGFADPYVAVAGLTFMKVNMPKQWVLYGSSNYSSTTVYWGSAVGGVRVNIFDLNSYSTSNIDLVKDRLGTIHHEFTHILNQRAIMPVEFAQISKARYTGTWETISTDSAQRVGFMRILHAKPNGGFCRYGKIPSGLGPSWFDDVVRNKANAEGAAALRAKEQSVINF